MSAADSPWQGVRPAPDAARLWIFVDPMCSWCWGFAPTLARLRETHPELPFALVMGGLHAGDATPMTPTARADILSHWRAVAARTGQPFRLDDALPDGFVYDTEPACRAVVAVGALDPARVYPCYQAIQTAFYRDGEDVTQPRVLTRLASGLGLDATDFLREFTSDAARQRVHAHFLHTRRAGVRGFPSMIGQCGETLSTLATGCLPYDTLRTGLDAWLAESSRSSAKEGDG